MLIPADVPLWARAEFRKNYLALTKGTDRFFLFAADHKIEHLDADFSGPHVDPSAHDPAHLFSIAQDASIGGFATQLGLIARYGQQHQAIQYIVKLNSKTNLVPVSEQDPFSQELWNLDEVLSFKKVSGFPIRGIGLTIYLGSIYEASMLTQAAHAIQKAHAQGLITILWIYPRGKAVTEDRNPTLLAGAVGVAAALGADFVKIRTPKVASHEDLKKALSFITQAAGTTKIIYAGGAAYDPHELLETIALQLSSGSSGVAIGRNIYQHSLQEALKLSQAISQLVYKT